MLPSRSSSHRAALASALLLALASTSSFASTMTGDDDELHYDDAGHATLTLDGANGTRIRNVAEGTEPTDAVNLNQMEAGDMMAVAAAKKYADVRTVNRMAVGVGAQNGKAALSLGYQRALGDKAALTIGAAFSGNERSAGVGYGFGW